MERYVGLDVHDARCTPAVISETGRKRRDFPVETHGQALGEAVRLIPGRKRLVFEEGLPSAWLYETLRPPVDEIVVDESRRAGGRRAASAMRRKWPRSYAWEISTSRSSEPRVSSRVCASSRGSK